MMIPYHLQVYFNFSNLFLFFYYFFNWTFKPSTEIELFFLLFELFEALFIVLAYSFIDYEGVETKFVLLLANSSIPKVELVL